MTGPDFEHSSLVLNCLKDTCSGDVQCAINHQTKVLTILPMCVRVCEILGMAMTITHYVEPPQLRTHTINERILFHIPSVQQPFASLSL